MRAAGDALAATIVVPPTGAAVGEADKGEDIRREMRCDLDPGEGRCTRDDKDEDGEGDGEGDDLRILMWTRPVGGRPVTNERDDADSETGAAPAAGRGRGRCICRRRVPDPPLFGGERVEEAGDASSARMRSGLSLSERTRIVSAAWVRCGVGGVDAVGATDEATLAAAAAFPLCECAAATTTAALFASRASLSSSSGELNATVHARPMAS